MSQYPIEVLLSGAILLGDITCDGFRRDSRARIQTHIHSDHMDDFETSKGLQDIFTSAPTRRLLIAEFNADLPFRDNLYTLELGVPCKVGDSSVTLFSSEHMLGSVQVIVELPNGLRIGYSGDFQWPLTSPIQVDALVVDSTYGSPTSRRKYSQDEAEGRFLDLVMSKLKHGCVHIEAHRGTLQRALRVLSGNVNCPFLGSHRLTAEVDVYREFGYAIDPIIIANSDSGKSALSGRYIRFYGKGDKAPIETHDGTAIVLSAFMTDPEDPVLQYTDRAFRIAMSNHADFDGTLEYIQSTGAKYVVTDNSRSGHAVELALEVKSRLGIEARP